MDQTVDDNTLNPLEWFHHAPGETPPSFDAVAGPDVPEPYRGLLVHERDMTSTLEAFVGQPLVLRVLRVHRADGCLHREVVLVGAEDGTMAEFGAIRIFVDRIPGAAAREAVEEGKRPLGAILREHDIAHRCEPSEFFHVKGNRGLQREFGVTGEHVLYGRQNRLYDAGGTLLAEVTEILPAFPNRGG